MPKELNKLDFFTLSVLVELYEQRSATVAAARLQSTQPKVSRALTTLREVFDDELFIRQQYGLEPNGLTETLYPLAKAVIDNFQPLSDALARHRSRNEELNVAAQEHLCPLLLQCLHLTREELGLSLTVNLHPWSNDVQKQLNQSQLDYCISINPSPSNRVTLYPIGEIKKFYLVARRDHPIFQRELTLEQAFAYPVALLNYSMSGIQTHRMELFAQKIGAPLSVSMKTTNLDLLLDHLESSDSIGYLASVLIQQPIAARKSLQALDISTFFGGHVKPNQSRPTYSLYLQAGRGCSPTFTDKLVNHLTQRISRLNR
ncbi:LysR family transcriptional regulator [Ferrimonas balearica]|uniref:LysR family transcriptional regulator n=1 Tax=Ferrimonas balearica TaxID=44012 RepID=UPI001C989634|nr:LysR family transcriptional regulator [Ferrimonas balearica]MBY5978673.1 LysR family transcriptional regulator [Ferrimonas balearica]MBY6094346.1 LysR family transcriptional regulator [Ferrimonas balearica]